MSGTSVLALKVKEGVLVGADCLASYGSMARYMGMPRVIKISEGCLVGGAGDTGDFQEVQRVLAAEERAARCEGLGFVPTARDHFRFLQRTLYKRRNKMDPLMGDFIVAGPEFIGQVDCWGTPVECKYAASGYGREIALPILRDRWSEELTREEGVKILEHCLKILYFRDARASSQIQIGFVGKTECVVSPMYELSTEGCWNIGEVAIHDPK